MDARLPTSAGGPTRVDRVAFVTGGTGFVGSHLVEELIRRGYREVRCLVRRDLRWLDGLEIVAVRANLFQDAPVRDALVGVTHVYHVGAVTRAREWSTFERENVEATRRLLESVVAASPGVHRVLITSSLAVVGRGSAEAADEETPIDPVSAYGRSKAQMERAIAQPHNGRPAFNERLPITVVRPPSVYGPREADIYTLFKTAKHGVFPVLGRGSAPELSLVHVRDLVRGMVDAAESPGAAGGTYFIGSDEIYSMRDIHRVMQEALGRRSLVIPVPHALVRAAGALSESAGLLWGTYPAFNREKAREARWACKMCRNDRAAADFGYRQQVSLEEGFRETVGWYRAHGWL